MGAQVNALENNGNTSLKTSHTLLKETSRVKNHSAEKNRVILNIQRGLSPYRIFLVLETISNILIHI